MACVFFVLKGRGEFFGRIEYIMAVVLLGYVSYNSVNVEMRYFGI